jgi:hypothetical protein
MVEGCSSVIFEVVRYSSSYGGRRKLFVVGRAIGSGGGGDLIVMGGD